MNKSLREDLHRIRSGLPVDWQTTKQRLHKAGIDRHLLARALDATAFSHDEYQITIVDCAAFDEIESLLQRTNNTSRSSASLLGNSHTATVKGAMLAVWCANETECMNRIFLDHQPQPKPSRRHGLIIENEECFLNKEDTYQFVTEYCGIDYPIDEIEFIYGSGNSITNRRIIPYLRAFKGDMLCLLDVDLGGLRIYANLLAAGLPLTTTHFLVPADLSKRLEHSNRQASDKELQALSKVYGYSELTDQIVKAIRYYKTTIEQESYRAR